MAEDSTADAQDARPRGRATFRLGSALAKGGRRLTASHRVLTRRPVAWTRRLYPAEHTDVVVLTARYGAGHWEAAVALRQAVERVYPQHRCLVLDYMELVNPALNRTIQSLYLASIKHFPEGYGWFYRATSTISPDSPWQSLLNSLGRERLARLVQDTSPRVIISTFPTQAGVLSDMRRLRQCDVPTVTVLTDNTVHNQWVHAHTDMYCVSSDEVAAELGGRGVPAERIAVTGIPIREAFRHPAPPAQTRARYGLDPDLPIILIMSGAFGALGGVGEACRALTHMRRPVQLIVVCGRDRTLARRLQYSTQNYPYPVHVFGWVEGVADLMVAARMIVTKAGGVTTAEALALGVPMVIFRPIPGQEEANTHYLARHGAARVAQDTAELEAHCEELLVRRDLWEGMHRSALAIGRPDAAQRVAELALRLGGRTQATIGPAGVPR